MYKMQYTLNTDGTYTVNVIGYMNTVLGPHRANVDTFIDILQKMCNYLPGDTKRIAGLFDIGMPLINTKLKTVVPVPDTIALRTNVNILTQCISQLKVLQFTSKTDPSAIASPYSIVVRYVQKMLLEIQPYRSLPLSTTNSNPLISGDAAFDDVLGYSICEYFKVNSIVDFNMACTTLYNTVSQLYGITTNYPGVNTFDEPEAFSSQPTASARFTITQTGNTYSVIPRHNAICGEVVDVGGVEYVYTGGNPLGELQLYFNLYRTVIASVSGQTLDEYNTLINFKESLNVLANITDVSAVMAHVTAMLNAFNPTSPALGNILDGHADFKSGLLALYSIYVNNKGLVLSNLADIGSYGALVVSSSLRQYNDSVVESLVAYIPGKNVETVPVGNSLSGNAANAVNTRHLCTVVSELADSLTYVMHYGVFKVCSNYKPRLPRELYGSFITNHYADFVTAIPIAFANDVVSATLSGNAATAYTLSPVTTRDIYSIGNAPAVNYYIYGCYDASLASCINISDSVLARLQSFTNTTRDITQYFVSPDSNNMISQLIAPLNDAIALSVEAMSVSLTHGAKMITDFKIPVISFPELNVDPFGNLPVPDYGAAIGRIITAASQDVVNSAKIIINTGASTLSNLEEKLTGDIAGEIIVGLTKVVNSSIGAYYGILNEVVTDLEKLMIDILKRLKLKITPQFRALNLALPTPVARVLPVATIDTVRHPVKVNTVAAEFSKAFIDLINLFDVVAGLVAVAVLTMVILKLL